LKRFVFFELRQEKKRSAWHLTKEAFLTADENETTSGERQGVSPPCKYRCDIHHHFQNTQHAMPDRGTLRDQKVRNSMKNRTHFNAIWTLLGADWWRIESSGRPELRFSENRTLKTEN
jgi:hypothetical protein